MLPSITLLAVGASAGAAFALVCYGVFFFASRLERRLARTGDSANPDTRR
jgi:hypothetical protein